MLWREAGGGWMGMIRCMALQGFFFCMWVWVWVLWVWERVWRVYYEICWVCGLRFAVCGFRVLGMFHGVHGEGEGG